MKREGWYARYATVGAGFRCAVRNGDFAASPLNTAARDLATVWIARTPRNGRGTPVQQALAQILRKLLQRGMTPPLDPFIERALLERHELPTAPSLVPGDLSPRSSRRISLDDVIGASAIRETAWALDPGLEWDSPREVAFLTRWLPGRLGAAAARWFIPQAPLEGLLTSFDEVEPGSRRVDFLLSAPWLGSPIVIEIDGPEHDAAVDAARDNALRSIGIDVIRIPNAEIDRGTGPQLDRVAAAWIPPKPSDPSLAQLLWGGAAVHRYLAAIAEALDHGLVPERRWSIELEDPTGAVLVASERLLTFIEAVGAIRGPSAVPDEVALGANGSWALYKREDRFTLGREIGPPQTIDLSLHLQGGRGPTEPLPAADRSRIVVRSAFLPVNVLDPIVDPADPPRPPIPEDPALTVMLQALFAKQRFREGQVDAVTNAMSARDCAVLLPTGAGKSLIYQLAGLCMPGRTVVVDPLVSLIENQLESLAAHGIDRAIGISSWTTQQGRTEESLAAVGSGQAYFTFIAPERLQTRTFRNAMRQLAQSAKIDIAVVDEAHCVSEWGHDFRTAYLDLGRVLREVCRDQAGSPPTILALTGTASRAVLRDVLFELGIDRQQEHAVIRPSSFDRRELTFDVKVVRPGDELPTLLGYLQTLPSRFGESPATFFATDGDETRSGLIFAPHVNGHFGVVAVAEEVGSALAQRTPYYSGAPPRGIDGAIHNDVRRQNARSFLGNDAPIMVSTKAFGMGIDKPNVRYVVHYGMPSSLEGYYQEAGRAGRDGNGALCMLLLSEFEEARNRRLLDDDVSLDAMRAAYDSVSRREQDDVTRQLFFYLNNFRGTERELATIREVLRTSGSVGEARTVELPFGEDRAERERALHRLVILGVLREYLVDFGSKIFELHLASIDANGVKERFFTHVERNQPGRLEILKDRVEALSPRGLEATISVCAEQLVHFIYDTVERSRRRALREMWLAARESTAQPNAEFRQRILDYLSQGDIAPSLERLIDDPRFSYGAWMDLIDEIDVSDLGEVRGSAARLLQSAPDHPGLLLCRGVVEAVATDGDLNEFGSAFRESLRFAQSRYGTAESELGSVSEWLVRLFARRRPAALVVALSVMQRQGVATDLVTRTVAAGHEDAAVDAALSLIGLSVSLDEMQTTIAGVLDNDVSQEVLTR
jgi:ATP-dependent DNA helicase RecQ